MSRLDWIFCYGEGRKFASAGRSRAAVATKRARRGRVRGDVYSRASRGSGPHHAGAESKKYSSWSLLTPFKRSVPSARGVLLAGIFTEIGEVASDDPAWLVPAGDHTLRGNGFSLSIPRLSRLFIACPPRCTAGMGVPG